MERPTQGLRDDRWARNRAHWSRTLDARNLSQEGHAIPLETELALAETADVRAALAALQLNEGSLVLELGGGLGLMAILMARRGARVVVADLSAERLLEARRRAEEAGVADRIAFLVCEAESLPFRDGAFNRQTTKSVLIHTRLREAAAELDRTLAPGGRAAFIEPLDGNPFVNAYRRLAAPKIWQSITDYFNHRSESALAAPFRRTGRRVSRRRTMFLAFLASPLNYTLGWPRAYRAAERLLMAADSLLPAAVRRWAWFTIVVVK